MKSLRPSRVLLVAGLLCSSAAFLAACTVDGTGLEPSGDEDASELDGSSLPDAVGGDATLDAGGGADADGPSSAAEAGDGAPVTPGADAEAAAPATDASDATIEIDGGIDASLDGSADTGTGSSIVDTGTPDASGGADALATDGSALSDAFDDVVATPDAAVVDAGADSAPAAMTTVDVIANALGQTCAQAAENNCLPPQCEDLSGMTGNDTNTSLCLATLACVISGSTATPYCGFQTDEPDECYCGATTGFGDCVGGQANGVCLAAEQNGFGTTTPSVITGAYVDPSTPSGLANSIADCMSSFPSCISGP